MKKTSASRKLAGTVSVAIPVFNEEESISLLLDQLRPVIDKLPYEFEILFVDDGSTDGTYRVIQDARKKDPRIKVLSFSRNFGHQAALIAGLQYATGNAVITMDGDLQHPPALIPDLIDTWREGFQIVYTIRESTVKESFFKRFTSRFFYRLINAFSDTRVQPFAADFRLLDRSVVDSLKTLKERDQFLRGLIGWMGYNAAGIGFTAGERAAGTSKYSTRKMIRLALDGILSFSAAPLHLVTYLGFAVSLMSFLYGAYSIYAYFFTNLTVSGWTSLLLAVLFLGGVQLISIGFLGEYLIRIYNETKARPSFIIKESSGIDTAKHSDR